MNYKALFKAIGVALLIVATVAGMAILLSFYPLVFIIISVVVALVWLIKLLYNEFNED